MKKIQKICCCTVIIHFCLILSSNARAQEIPLQEGWNLFSFSINTTYYDTASPPTVASLSNTTFVKVDSLNDVLLSINGKYSLIRNIDSTGARTFDPNVPSFFNTLHYLAPGYGYYIKMNVSATLSLNGGYASPSDKILLQPGWNLVGCWHNEVQYESSNPPSVPIPSGISSTQVTSVSDIFASIAGKYSVIVKYDKNGAGIFDPNLPVYLNSLKYVSPGYGYLIKMTESAYFHY